jgi:GNAT superfamily N-acetyltransferase
MSTATLSDGTRVVLRPIGPGDAPTLAAGLGRLSPASVHARFFTAKPRFTAAELRYLTEVDMVDHVALVAALEDEPDGLVAVGRFVRDRTTGRGDGAEIAVTVCDALQGRGLGRALGLALAGHARARGITRFTATMLPDNAAALALFRTISSALHHEVRNEVHQGVRELVADLAA